MLKLTVECVDYCHDLYVDDCVCTAKRCVAETVRPETTGRVLQLWIQTLYREQIIIACSIGTPLLSHSRSARRLGGFHRGFSDITTTDLVVRLPRIRVCIFTCPDTSSGCAGAHQDLSMRKKIFSHCDEKRSQGELHVEICSISRVAVIQIIPSV